MTYEEAIKEPGIYSVNGEGAVYMLVTRFAEAESIPGINNGVVYFSPGQSPPAPLQNSDTSTLEPAMGIVRAAIDWVKTDHLQLVLTLKTE